MMIHTGVDERDYWFSAKKLLLGLPYDDVQHRTVRFAVILPVLAAQALLGTHPNVYYVMPLVVSLVQVALMYRVGVELHGRAAGFLAALMLALFPYMIRAGSQVRPDIFALTYVLASVLFFLRYLRGGARSRRRLLLSSLLMFAAYESKITSLYFVPGFVASILLLRRGWRDAALFCAPLLALYAVEHALFYLLFGEPLGHPGIILGHHLSSEYAEATTFWGLLQRYSPRRLPLYWIAALLLFVPAALLLRRRDPRYRALVLLAASFFFFVTFAVAGIDPVVPVEDFHHRYLLAALGPVLILDAALLVEALGLLRPLRLSSRRAGALLAVAAVLCVAVFSADVLPRGARLYFNNPLRPREHPLSLNNRYLEVINEAFASGTPILASDNNAGRNALATCTHYFLHREHWPSGRLPQARRVEIAGAWYSVLQAQPWTPAPATAIVAARRNPFEVVRTTVEAAHEEVREGEASSE
jgi:4-amino-4-deoxy-L-arabinose transferase-like glycosyltransferase